MNIIVYEALPPEAAQIRETVFIKEQGFQNEFDGIDNHAKHLVLYHNEAPIATCRFFTKGTSESYVIGRIAVLKGYRGQNIGSYLLEAAECEIKKLGGKYIFLHSQNRVKSFYEKLGYHKYGEIDFDESCPHIWMRKKLSQ